MNWLEYLKWKTDLLKLLNFLCVLLCTGAATTRAVAGREQLRCGLLAHFACHPAEAWDGPAMATGPEGRVSMRVSTLLEIVRRHHPLLKMFVSVKS